MALNIDPKQILTIMDDYDNEMTATICYFTLEDQIVNGKLEKYRKKHWEKVPRSEAAQLAEMMNKVKKQQEDFDKRNGVIHAPNDGERIKQREREILRKVRDQKFFKGESS